MNGAQRRWSFVLDPRHRLEWKDVNLQDGTITVSQTKTKRPRMIPTTSRVNSMLSQAAVNRVVQLKSPDLIFSHIPIKWGGHLSRKIRKAGKEVGIDGMRFHDLRHWFCTNLTRAGIPIGDVMLLSGHTTLQMAQRYSCHSPMNAGRAAIATMEQASKTTAAS